MKTETIKGTHSRSMSDARLIALCVCFASVFVYVECLEDSKLAQNLENLIESKQQKGQTFGDPVLDWDNLDFSFLNLPVNDDMDKRTLLRYGKRGGLMRYGKRGGLMRYGKRGGLMRYGKRDDDDVEMLNAPSGKRVFRWGKRDMDMNEAKRLLRWGKRDDASDVDEKRTLLRYGKRDDDADEDAKRTLLRYGREIRTDGSKPHVPFRFGEEKQ